MNRLLFGARIANAFACATTLATLAAFCPTAAAEQPIVVWSQLIATAQDDESRGIALDGVGGLHIGGITSGALPDPVLGSGYSFVEKFDTTGDDQWGHQYGSTGDSSYVTVDDLAADAAGMYAAGSTFGNVGGVNAGTLDAYVRKYDLGGTILWSRQIGVPEIDAANGVDSDGAGMVYVGGQTDGDLTGSAAGGRDAFLSKYDAAGTRLWLTQFGSPAFDNSLDVAVDAAGNAYSAGFTYGDVGGANAGDQDFFVAKHDSDGVLQWARQNGTIALDQGVAASVDASGNIYVAGVTRGLLGAAEFGGLDVFLAKFDPLGAQLWLTQWGTDQADYVGGLAVDATGDAYVVGGKANNPDGGTITGEDSYLVKFDPLGNPLWSHEWNAAVIDQAQAVVADDQGNVYVTGIQSTTRFDPYDVYLVKFAIIPEPSGAILSAIALTLLVRSRRRFG